MSKEKTKVPEREATLGISIAMLLLVVVILALGIIGCGWDAHIPLAICCAVLLIYGTCYMHISFGDLRDEMIKSVSTSMEVMFIILMIGGTVGTWIASGTVPYIIVLGLKVFSPRFFWISILLICIVMSVVTGSSWTTMGTVGVAFMGVGAGLGVNPAITAGCIACGAFFGDKQSPMSDSTNYAAAVAKTDLYKHTKSMLYSTGPAIIISGIIFLVMGLKLNISGDTSAVTEIIDGLSGAFHFSPVLLIPLIIMIVLIVLKFPALPTMMGCALIGGIFTVLFQGATIAQAGVYFYSGYVGETGNETIDKLLTRGGLSSMYYTLALMMLSLGMAGLIGRCGIISCIMSKLDRLTDTRVGLILTHLVTGYALSYIAADCYIAMLLPANAFEHKYEKLGLDRSVMSRTMEDSGTLVLPMVPWGSSGVYTAVTLGVATMSYFPFYFMGFINPICSMICAITGFGMIPAEKTEN